jgi:hypothetical protein
MPENEPKELFERLYTASELAKLLNVSRDLIARRFANEPGVLDFSRPALGKRIYRTLRIPQSVATRVYKELSLRKPLKRRE